MKVKTILCCVLLWSHALTDAYGLSSKGTNKSKNDQQAVPSKKAKQDKVASQNKERLLKITVNRKAEPDNKIMQEINELKRMYEQLKQENVSKEENDKKQQLLQHIENQIKLRQRKQAKQQLSKQQQSPHKPVERKPQLAQTKKVRQLSNPVQSVSSNHVQYHSTLQDINQRVKAQTNDPPYSGSSKQQTQISVTNRHALPNSRDQNEAIIPQAQIQHYVQKETPRINAHPNTRTTVQHMVPQQHILVPLSALSSYQMSSGQGMLSDKVILVNSLVKNDAVAGFKVDVAQKRQPTQPPPTTTSFTSPPTTPTTTVLTSPPTTPGAAEIETSTAADVESMQQTLLETSTAADVESMQQTLLERSLKKQSLEIRKLQLEIRALQREERSNLPDEEDGPQPRRYGPRRMLYPFLG